MATEKIVKCYVRRMSDPEPPKTPRFVPLELFSLWKFLMEERHHLKVTDRVTSLWFEKGASSDTSYMDIHHERVVQLELFYFSDQDGMLHQEVRYFPADSEEDYEKIKRIFLSHYTDIPDVQKGKPRVNENPGIWIKREAPLALFANE